MTTPRKRPECRTCNTPMAGHKRPDGKPVCPIPSPAKVPNSPHKTDDDDDEQVPQIGKFYHFVNPNYRESFTPEPVEFGRPQRTGTPCTWVSTEPADDIPSVKHEGTLQRADARHIPDIEITGYRSSQSSISSSSSMTSTASSRFRRTFYGVLTKSLPAVSLFAAPRDEIATITQAARMNGLHTGVMRWPRPDVKDESGSSRSRRRYSWWVLLGRDPEAVEHLMELQEREDMSRLDGQVLETPAPVAVSEVVTLTAGPNPFHMILFSAVGALGGVFIWVMILSVW